MKRITVSVFIIVSLLVISLCRGTAMAEDAAKEKKPIGVSIGFTGQLTWWDAVWSKYHITLFPVIMSAVTSSNPALIEANPDYFENSADFNALYGPLISVKISGPWSMSASFLYGRFFAQGEDIIFQPQPFPVQIESDVRKYDGDVLVNYQINRWVKIYFGPKYQGYYEKNIYSIWPDVVMQKKDVLFSSYGFGAGVGFTVHLVDNLYLLPGISLLTLFGDQSIRIGRNSAMINVVRTPGPPSWIILSEFMTESRSSTLIGCLGSLNFAYVIQHINTTISLGFKSQYLYYLQTPSSRYRQDYDLFYGINLSIVYSF